MSTEITFRQKLTPEDVQGIRRILEATGFFFEYEVEIGASLASENLEKGEAASGYFFDLAESGGKLLGYSCYGATPCTLNSWDLYWIAVDPTLQSRGLGKQLMNRMMNHIREMGGRSIWIETSSRPLYEPTRQFYIRYGCEILSQLPDFYGPGDDKLIFRFLIS